MTVAAHDRSFGRSRAFLTVVFSAGLALAIGGAASGCAAAAPATSSGSMAPARGEPGASSLEAQVHELDRWQTALDADWQALAMTPVCPDVCRLAERICEASRKICEIASQHPEQTDLGPRCQRAEGRCQHAQGRCKTCSP